MAMLEDSNIPTWLPPLAEQAQTYVRDVLDTPFALRTFEGGRAMPYFLQDRYQFLEGEILGHRCVFMTTAPHGLDSPANVAKHVQQVRQATRSMVVVLTGAVTAYNRKRLIGQRVNFLVPGAQLFLPELALDLREYYRSAARPLTTGVDKFSPTAQMIIIAGALGDRLNGLNATSIAGELGVSAMSVGRAFDELRPTNLVMPEPQTREHRLHFAAIGRDLWDLAQPRLRSPVRKTRGASHRPQGAATFLAGESALARYTSLADPQRTTIAIHAHDWKRLVLDHALDMVEPADNPPFLIETWSYHPGALARQGNLVDPLSLYLSLDLVDERIEIAADDLIKAAFP